MEWHRLRASESLLADVIGNIDAGVLMEVDGAEQDGWIHITRVDDQPVDGWARHSIGPNSAVVGQHLAFSSTMMTNPWDQTLHALFDKCVRCIKLHHIGYSLAQLLARLHYSFTSFSLDAAAT